ncbi:NAD-dependent epimerase/dehydratase family protein [Lacrimispora saccharolytica]|uniref:NAD-dependent epimerase/dehydratase n=1 Tax=Lacrimispora saccharolytica (strain ATCC 35040 / DSM 2544 / NRCC 2533 / WM1) TaxID=610130 RepID=D9RA28_LACSW|nr:NAD(P)-dependent oxidoreductase [Lacrimispora saccharolytica]ADL06000.1 NAD-dependent epimerase/dehydratase [[Clostridium] saccharolyticum WM1]QRV19872.1 NAD(P)-dependent oxidoreductase [Lacrimispora saccharolytica]
MKNVLLTGASGFIGSHVRKCLHESGYGIISLCKNPGEDFQTYDNEKVVKGNLSEPELLKQALTGCQIEACIHLAWEGIPDYSFEMSQRNLTYGINVLELCRHLGIGQLVVSGSCWEYRSPHGKVAEDWELDDSNHFKAAKNAYRMIAHAFCREAGIRFNWLRLFYVYGPGQREGSLIPFIKKELSEGRVPELRGAGNRNDFVHVWDVARAFVKAVKVKTEVEILNIGYGMTVSVSDVLKYIAEAMDKKNLIPQDTPYDNPQTSVDFYADIANSRDLLGWEPNISLKEWLQKGGSYED